MVQYIEEKIYCTTCHIRGKETLKKIHWIIKSVIFIILGLAIFAMFNIVLVHNDENHIENTIKGLYELDDNTEQVIFLGTSHVACGVSPMEIYKESGITTYNLATNIQPIEGSYYLLKETLKTRQNPQMVVLDASSLFFDEYGSSKNIGLRYILDNMQNGKNKYELLNIYKEMDNADDLLTCIVPFVKYHTKWESLETNKLKFNGWLMYSCGQYIRSNVNGTNYTIEDINEEAEALEKMENGIEVSYYEDGGVMINEKKNTDYSTDIPRYNEEYLQKIISLCDENNIKLVVTKIPVNVSPAQYSSSWTKKRYEAVMELSQKYGFEYLDLIYGNVELKLDWEKDTLDGGMHLNNSGAKKVSSFFANYLTQCGIKKQENEVYDKFEKTYDKVIKIAELQQKDTLDEYLAYLQENNDNWITLISSSKNLKKGISKETENQLQELGLKAVNEVEKDQAYFTVLNGKSNIYEVYTNRTLEYKNTEWGKNINVNLISPASMKNPSNSVMVDKYEYALADDGINIIVYDKESEMVIDNVCIEAGNMIKHGDINTLFSNYENKIMEIF